MSAVRLDLVCAAAVGVTAFAVYLRTLAPGLVAVFDSPMFQFIGRVLGVPHNPGYPLYVLLTYPFSYLPVGNLAYRINLFSAVLATVTVSLVFLLLRRLGVRRLVSAAVALGLAFGQVFWSQAIIAEVYTLNSALVVGMLLAMLVWGQTGRQGFFFLSIALFAAGLGNHTTIVGFAPGMVLYALMANRRFALQARTLVISAFILTAGLLQYGFIILRTRQDAYVESGATTIGELIGVMSGRQFGNRLFAFDWRALLLERVPLLVERVLVPELTVPGLILSLVGIAWLLRSRPAEALLILLGGAAIFAFTLNYAVVDSYVFLIPTLIALWTGVGFGAERLAGIASTPRWAVGIVVGSLMLVPAWQLARNFTATDRSRDANAAVIFDRLFEAMSDRTALVREDFLVDRMVMFKLRGEQAAGTRDVRLIPRNANALTRRLKEEFTVLGFQRSVRELRFDALNFDYSPVVLRDGSLEAFLQRLSDRSVVALAVPGMHAGQFAAIHSGALTAIGSSDGLAGVAGNVAVIGVRGAGGAPRIVTSGRTLTLQLGAGDDIDGSGAALPAAVEIRANGIEASIRQGDRDLAWTADGAVMAVWNPEGELEDTFSLQASDNFSVPIPTSPLSVYPLRGVWPGEELSSSGWTDVANATRTGSTMLRVPAASVGVLYLGSRHRLVPRPIDRSSSRAPVEIASFDGLTRQKLGERLAEDQAAGRGLEQWSYVYRLEVRAPRNDALSVLMAFGGIPAAALGRAIGGLDSSSAPAAFQIDTTGLLRTPDRFSELLLMSRGDPAQLVGDGWSAVDADEVSPYRWMIGTEAGFLLPLAQPDARRVRLQALREQGGAPTIIGLRLNGTELPPQDLQNGWHTYEWPVPDGVFRPLTNEVVVTVDRLSPPTSHAPERGIAVADFRVLRGS